MFFPRFANAKYILIWVVTQQTNKVLILRKIFIKSLMCTLLKMLYYPQYADICLKYKVTIQIHTLKKLLSSLPPDYILSDVIK